MINEDFPPYDFFFSSLRNSNPHEKDYYIAENIESGLSTQQAVAKLREDNGPTTGAEKNVYLQIVC